MYEKETITQIELARHDAAARDVYPHALWGGHGHKRLLDLPLVMAM